MQTLERQKAFPVVSWLLIIAFIILAYYLIDLLREKSQDLESGRSQTENALEQDLRVAPIEY